MLRARHVLPICQGRSAHAETADRLESVIASAACGRACACACIINHPFSLKSLPYHLHNTKPASACLSSAQSFFFHFTAIVINTFCSRCPCMAMTLPKNDQQSQSIPREPDFVGRKPSMHTHIHPNLHSGSRSCYNLRRRGIGKCSVVVQHCNLPSYLAYTCM